MSSSAYQVISIEKAESTSLLPNPVIVSVRSKKAFQFIELQGRDELVDSLTARHRALQWKHSMFRSSANRTRSLVSLCFLPSAILPMQSEPRNGLACLYPLYCLFFVIHFFILYIQVSLQSSEHHCTIFTPTLF